MRVLAAGRVISFVTMLSDTQIRQPVCDIVFLWTTKCPYNGGEKEWMKIYRFVALLIMLSASTLWADTEKAKVHVERTPFSAPDPELVFGIC